MKSLHEPSHALVKAFATVSSLASSLHAHDKGEVTCDPKSSSCREDGIACPTCKVFVCAWHYWSAGGVDYCPGCASKVRFDELPMGPSDEKKVLVKDTLVKFFGPEYAKELVTLDWFEKAKLVEEILHV